MLGSLQSLKHLHLGFQSYLSNSQRGLRDLWTRGLSNLQELTLNGLELDASVLMTLAEYTHLKALGMDDCLERV